MAASSLTDIAIKMRQIIRYGIVAFILIIIGRFALGVAINLYSVYGPKPAPPPPTVGFNRLPEISFPDRGIELPELHYTVEIPPSTITKYPIRIYVFFMPKKTAVLSSYDDMVKIADSFGFTSQPIQLSESLFRFIHNSLPSTLEINIVKKRFSVSYNLAADSAPLNQRPPVPEVAKSTVVKLLQGGAIYPTDLADGTSEHEFLKVEGQNLVRALSLSDANLVRVNLFRKGVTLSKDLVIPTVTADPNRANVWFIVSGVRGAGGIIAGEYKYTSIAIDQPETYPIKTLQDALNDLNTGQAYIANLGLNVDGNVTIRRAYLAYYDPEQAGEFFQPVYVFEGDGDFTAYVPAVTNDYYGAIEASPSPVPAAE